MTDAPSIADRLEVIELVVRYAAMIDSQAYAELDSVFTEDALIDYRSVGGLHARFPDVVAWLPGAMSRFEVTQHFVSNVRFTVDGEALRTRAYVRATHGFRKEGALVFFDLGGEYHDRVVRTPAGLRIAERTLVRRWTQGEMPPRAPRA